MNLLSLTGDNAPVVALDGARLTLRYDDLVAYSRRCTADDLAVRALASHVVIDANVEQPRVIGAPAGSGPMVATYTLAPKPLPTESPKPRR